MKTTYSILIILIFFASLASCLGSQEEISTKEFVLTTGFEEGNLAFLGVSGEINGVYNPVLAGEPGEVVTVTLINGGYAAHNFSVPDLNLETRYQSPLHFQEIRWRWITTTVPAITLPWA